MCSREESQAEINLILVSNYFNLKKEKRKLELFCVEQFWISG